MYYRMLGNTGIQVSVLSYGFWATFGVKQGLTEAEGIAAAKEILQAAREGGINLFDNAEAYGNPAGEAERIMGEAVAQLTKEQPELWHRSELVITTKVFWGGAGVNQTGLSRKHVREGLDAALTRLQVDYVDLVFCHRPDPHTPTETVVRAMTDMVRSGRATAWGTSEWSAQQFTEAVWLARQFGLEPPQFEQPQYSLIHRDRVEKEYAPLYQPPYRMGLTTWSPLASGVLTGKYNDGVPEGSRLAQKGYEFLAKLLEQHRASGTLDKVKQLTEWARAELDCSVAQLAIAWVARNPNVSTVLLGATKRSQIEENLGAISVLERLTDDHMAHIDEVMGNRPAAYEGWGGTGRRALKTI
ncbi:MAG: aldo/keto reductase [Myxococcota bacterium]